MNIARYDLWNYDSKKHARSYYADCIYVITHDDGSARILRRDRKISRWNIYKNFDEAAAEIEKMTKNNLYILADIFEEDDPWTYWDNPNHYIAIRYDHTVMSREQQRHIADCDRWHRNGIILRNHYYKKTALFTQGKRKEVRWQDIPCPF